MSVYHIIICYYESMSKGPGIAQRKILLLLLGGFALGLSTSPRRSFRILKYIGKEWNALNREVLHRSIRTLYRSHLVGVKHEENGLCTLILSEAGRRRALAYKIDDMKIEKQHSWDRKWRIVTFDIPERKRRLRDTLRSRLRQLGMIEFQKSIFVHPYPCDDEIDFLVELYHARPFVRKITAESVDNGLHYKHKFGLLLFRHLYTIVYKCRNKNFRRFDDLCERRIDVVQ